MSLKALASLVMTPYYTTNGLPTEPREMITRMISWSFEDLVHLRSRR